MERFGLLIGKGRIKGHTEEMECDYCHDALCDGDSTLDLYRGSMDESDMVARFCCKNCLSAYIEKS